MRKASRKALKLLGSAPSVLKFEVLSSPRISGKQSDKFGAQGLEDDVGCCIKVGCERLLRVRTLPVN